AGERAQVQRVLHVGREVRGGQRGLCALFPQGPAGAYLRQRAGLARTVRYRDRLHRHALTRSRLMFSVIFEVHPKTEQWDTYLGTARLLKPEIERIDGFIDNVRYRSLTREGWVLSLSGWRDEKALVRWRTQAGHHMAQEKGRGEILADYHLRVGQV